MIKIQPQDMAAYLDSVRPMMEDIEVGSRVDVHGLGKYLQVSATDSDAYTVRIELTHSSKWIRVEQIEYIHPY